MNPFDFFSKNIFLKLLSLAFAILLWFFVVLEDKVEQAVQVEIRVKNLPANLILVKPPPPSITVYVTGPRSILRNLTHRPLVLTIDLEDFKPGSHTVFFREKDIDLPAGLKITKIEPSQIEIILEREVEKTVSVEPGIYGSPPPGWKIAEIEVIPKKVKVRGPKSVVYRLRRVRTKPVDINGLTGFVTRKVPLDLPDLVQVKGPSLVEVRIRIVEHVVTREFKDLPIEIRGAKGKVDLERRTANTILQGPERLLGPFAKTRVKAFVDVKGLKPGRYLLELRLEIPAGVKLLKLEPKKVKVRIFSK